MSAVSYETYLLYQITCVFHSLNQDVNINKFYRKVKKGTATRKQKQTKTIIKMQNSSERQLPSNKNYIRRTQDKTTQVM